MPDFQHSVDFIVLLPNTLNFGAQIRVPFGTIKRQVRVSGDRCMRIKCEPGDWQNPANLLDTQITTVLVDELDHRLNGQASSVPLPGSRLTVRTPARFGFVEFTGLDK